MSKNKYKKEKNCSYPYEENSPINYCWGYAEAIDNKKTIEEIERTLCANCELFGNSG